MRVKFIVIAAATIALTAPALAQSGQKTNRPPPNYSAQSRTPVATQPSNNPFKNPIGQGVPPAASANPNQNSNRTYR